MTAKLIDGRVIADAIKKKISKAVATYATSTTQPRLDVILVGDQSASAIYVKHKANACQAVGIQSNVHRLPEDVTQAQLEQLIAACNADTKIHGILLQLPLPKHLCADDLLELIDPKKDVDGFHPYNLGRLAQRRPLLRPCTPYGIITMLNTTGLKLEGRHAVVIGASNIVGRPMALELLLTKCTVTVCHRFTLNLATHVQVADILISAVGRPGVVQSNWIKPGAVVVDVGFTRLDDGRIVGDIEFESAKANASWITPVPGGVGQMTVATLLQNTVEAFLMQR